MSTPIAQGFVEFIAKGLDKVDEQMKQVAKVFAKAFDEAQKFEKILGEKTWEAAGKVLKEMSKTLEKAQEGFRNAGKAASLMGEGIAKLDLGKIGAGLNGLAASAGKALGSVQPLFVALADGAIQAGNALVGKLGAAFNQAAGMFSKAGSAGQTFLKGIATGIQTVGQFGAKVLAVVNLFNPWAAGQNKMAAGLQQSQQYLQKAGLALGGFTEELKGSLLRLITFGNVAALTFSGLVSSISNFSRMGLQGTGVANLIGAQMQFISREIASIFLPSLNQTVEVLQRLHGFFRNLSGTQQDFIRRLVESSAVALVLATVLPKVTVAVGALIGGVQALSLTALGLTGSLSGGLVPLLQVAGVALGAFFVGTDKGREILKKLWGVFQVGMRIFGVAFEVLGKAAAPVFNRLATMFDAFLKKTFGGNWEAVLIKAAVLFVRFGKAVLDIVDRIATKFMSWLSDMNPHFQKIGDKFGELFNRVLAMAPTLGNLGEKILDLALYLGELALKAVPPVIDGMIWLTGVVERFWKVAARVLGGVKQLFGEAEKQVTGFGNTWEGATQKMDKTKGNTGFWSAFVIGPFKDIAGWMKVIGEHANTMWKALTGKDFHVMDPIYYFLGTLRTIKILFNSVVDTSGKWWQSLFGGTKKASESIDQMGKSVSGLSTAFQFMIELVNEKIKTMINTVTWAAQQAANVLNILTMGQSGAMLDSLRQLVKDIRALGKDAFDKMWEGTEEPKQRKLKGGVLPEGGGGAGKDGDDKGHRRIDEAG